MKHLLDHYLAHPISNDTSNGFTVLYSPMASGKTTLYKSEFAHHPKVLMIAPYKTCREGLGLECEPHKGLRADYAYMTHIFEEIAKHCGLMDCGEVPCAVQTEEYIRDWLDSYGAHLNGKLIIIDEVDFLWTQARMDSLQYAHGTFKTIAWLEPVLKALSERCRVIGMTACYVPFIDRSWVKEVVVHADTSINIASMKIFLYNNVKTEKVMEDAVAKVHKDSPGEPTLVYNWHYTRNATNSIARSIRNDAARPILYGRSGNLAKEVESDAVDSYTLEQVGYPLSKGKGDKPSQVLPYVMAHAKRSTLENSGSYGNDPITDGDGNILYISNSHSRQAGLWDFKVPFHVIIVGSQINASHIQTIGRGRNDPLHVEIHLGGKTQEDVMTYSGDSLIAKCERIDPFMRDYGLTADKVECVWVGNLGALKGKAIGKAISPDTALRRTLMDRMVKQHIKHPKTKTKQYKLYLRWLNIYYPDSKPFAVNAFNRTLLAGVKP